MLRHQHAAPSYAREIKYVSIIQFKTLALAHVPFINLTRHAYFIVSVLHIRKDGQGLAPRDSIKPQPWAFNGAFTKDFKFESLTIIKLENHVHWSSNTFHILH